MCKKVAVVELFMGELGWEVVGYSPHVDKALSVGDFDKVLVMVRPGREVLYPKGTHFIVCDVPTKNASGNILTGIKGKHITSVHRKRFKQHVAKFRAKGYKCTEISSQKLEKGRGKVGRRHVSYIVPKAINVAWRRKIPKGVPVCVLCYRDRAVMGKVRNWRLDKWTQLALKLKKQGIFTVLVGKLEEAWHEHMLEKCVGLNLLDQTSLVDLVAIFNLSQVVVGQSTGIMHLASYCGSRHVVWGKNRKTGNKTRKLIYIYARYWNPLKTWNRFVQGGWDPSVTDVLYATNVSLRV